MKVRKSDGYGVGNYLKWLRIKHYKKVDIKKQE